MRGIQATVDEREALKQTIAELEARLADLKRRLPAHSITPAMIAELDELDERLEEAREALSSLTEENSPRSTQSTQRK